MSKRALITGITGQDGSYLADLLLEKGYEVFGLSRTLKNLNCSRIANILDQIQMIEGDLTDQPSLNNALAVADPDEIYNFAARSFVGTSWENPVEIGEINGLGVLRFLEAIRLNCPDTKFYQASSSEMFGKSSDFPQRESTPFHPRSPYGCAKVYAYWATVNFRENYNMFCCSGILYNHESPRRGSEYVSRKITDGVARIHHGLEKSLVIGNLDAMRDWGFAGDYILAIWLMLQQDTPEDYVIATGKLHSVREFVDLAFREVGLNYEDYIVVDKKLFRPAEEIPLVGDASRAKDKLGWKPEITFSELIRMMVRSDVALYERTSVRNNQ